ncbi:MAG: hypothetical protein J6C80_06965, partial [Flavobacteriales bacterium]|nr:hypothetical protein [Flavobacteriales bacterium]
IHLRCFSISSEIAKKLGASKTSFAVQSKVSALFPIFYQILREKQRGHFFLSRRIFKTTRCGYSTKRLAYSEPFILKLPAGATCQRGFPAASLFFYSSFLCRFKGRCYLPLGLYVKNV